MSRAQRLERLALTGLFFLALLPRALHPVSRPLQWYFRAAQFFQAVLHHDWAGTLFSEHPGVTVMWLSGAALWGRYALLSLLGLHPPTPLETEGYAFADRVATGVLPLALLVALGIIWTWFLLRRLFDRRVAWAGALLLALDPFYIANSESLHLDALLSTLMLLSALLTLLYLRQHRMRLLVASAALGGLAILTKVSAIFLVPFTALALAPSLLPSASAHLLPSVSRLLRDLLIWLAVAALVCFALWPALWVQPAQTLNVVLVEGIIRHVDQAHSLPRFHRGVVTIGDPGIGFYLDTLLFRSTFITLPFALLGLLLAATRRREETRSLLLLAAFAVFYLAQMSLGGRKEGRYMLPVLLQFDLIAGAGLAWWTKRLRARSGRPLRAVIPLLVAAQALAVLPRFPYFGTWYNPLAGGPTAGVRALPAGEFGSGLDLAGRYIDAQPDGARATVATQFLANEMVAQYVRGPVYDIAQVEDEADYVVFGVQYTTRGREYPRWGALWDEYRFREPALTVTFDHIPYAWVYRPGAPAAIPHPVNARLGEQITLLGYRLQPPQAAPGETLLLTLYWQPTAPLTTNYTVFVHLLGPDGCLAAQQDNPPVRGTRPTDTWTVGETVEDTYELHLPADAPRGTYALSSGMYSPASGERLPAWDATAAPLPEDRIPLTTVTVQPLVPPWQWALAAAWLTLIAAGAVYPRLRRRR